MTPFLAVSLNLRALQAKVTPRHLVGSFIQHVADVSALVQDPPAQYVVAAVPINFRPTAHVTVEHFARFEQHRVSGLPTVPTLLASKYLLTDGQGFVMPPHLVVSAVQQSAASAITVQGFPTHNEFDVAVFDILPTGHVNVEHAALFVQQVATPLSANTPYLDASL
jgi:hypothetical protein